MRQQIVRSRLISAFKMKKITVSGVAKSLGCSNSALSMFIAGKRFLSIELLEKLDMVLSREIGIRNINERPISLNHKLLALYLMILPTVRGIEVAKKQLGFNSKEINKYLNDLIDMNVVEFDEKDIFTVNLNSNFFDLSNLDKIDSFKYVDKILDYNLETGKRFNPPCFLNFELFSSTYEYLGMQMDLIDSFYDDIMDSLQTSGRGYLDGEWVPAIFQLNLGEIDLKEGPKP